MAERSVMVRLRANADQFNREMMKARSAVAGVRDEIDTTNDRTAWLAQGLLALAPAMVPIGAAAIPVLTGIATQAVVGATALGTMVAAFQGIGDALKALDKYRLDPTAENLEKLHQAMKKLGPDGADFVRVLDDARQKLSILQMDARKEMFPGMTEGIENALKLLPQLRTIVQEVSSGLGELSIDAGKGLVGDDMRRFFDYLEHEAKPILVDMGHTAGNFFAGFANLLVDFAPLSKDFSTGLLDMSRSFNDWSQGLDRSQTFQEFVQYIRESGPQVLDLLGSLVAAFVQLVEAAAPVGSAMLPVLTKFFDILAAIADTPVGSFFVLTAALTSMYGRVKALQSITTGGVMGGLTKGIRDSGTAAKASIPSLEQWRLALLNSARSQKQLKDNIMQGSTSYAVASARASSAKFAVSDFLKAAGPAAAAGGLLALSMSGVADKAGLSNTAMGAMTGLMVTGGPWGAAIGGAVGLTTDLASSFRDMDSAIQAANHAMESDSVARMRATIKGLKDEIATGAGGVIKTMFGQIPELWGGDTFDEKQKEVIAKILELRGQIGYLRKEGHTGAGWDAHGFELYYEALGMTADEAHRAAMGVDEFRRATERAMGILSQQEAFDDFQAAIDAATKSLKDNGKTLDNHTEKGRNNRAALRDIASTALKAADGLKGLQRKNYIEGAADRFVEFAQKMGMSEDAAKRLAARLFDLDKLKPKPHISVDDREAQAKIKKALRDLGALDHKTGSPQIDMLIKQFLRGKLTVEQAMHLLDILKAHPEVLADTDQAIAKIHGVISAMSSIHDKVVHIQTVFSRNNLDVDKGADGATVPKTGRPYADRHLYLLADGERVTSNRHGQVDQSPKLLDLINQGRLNDRMMGLADGGTAGVRTTITYRGDPPATRAADDEVSRQSRHVSAELKRLRSSLKQATDALDKEKQQRDALIDKMRTLTTDVSGGLRSDLFAETDVWSSQYGGTSPDGVMSTLRGDNRDARRMLAAIRELKAKGLHGPALAEVLREGGLAAAQAFADLSRAELREYAELYNTRSRLTRAAGESAGGAAYGAALRQEQHQYRELKQEVIRLRHAVERNGKHNREDHKADRDAQRRGAGNASRNRRRD